MDEREQAPLADARLGPAGDVAGQAPAGWSRNQLIRRRKSGRLLIALGLEDLDGQERDQPRPASAPGAGRPGPCRSGARRSRSRPTSSHSETPAAAQVVEGPGDVQEVLEELGRDVLVDQVVAGPARGRSPACSGRTCPSRPCRRPGRGGPRRAAARRGRTGRCCPGRGSRPGRHWRRRGPCG